MRLITQFPRRKRLRLFAHLLEEHKINSYIEAFSKGEEVEFLVWAVEEDDYPHVEELLAEFEKNTALYIQKAKEAPPPPVAEASAADPQPIVIEMPKITPRRGLTRMLLFLCVFIFLWVSVEESQIVKEKGILYLQIAMTPLQRKMVYDYPEKYEKLADLLSHFKLASMNDLSTLPSKIQEQVHQAEKAASWNGIYPYFEDALVGKETSLKAPMFEKIKTGEVWRLVTPVLLHGGFLHILFNMCWLWVIGFQVEQRLGKLRMLFLMILIALVSNSAQYFMSGPFFVGLSGVICGLVGFIWQRQKVAPWEGYPLNHSTIAFLAYFVFAIVLLQFIAFILKITGVLEVTPQIANTAHISGAITGILLAKIKLFSRKLA